MPNIFPLCFLKFMALSLAGGSSGVEVDKTVIWRFCGFEGQERRRGCRDVWESGGFDGEVWRRKRVFKVVMDGGGRG